MQDAVQRRGCRRWRRAAALLAVASAFACSAKRLEPVAARPIDQLTPAEVGGGLRIAIDPLLDDRANEAQYGIDFLDREILAVRVSAENRDPAASYALLPGALAIVAPGQGAARRLDESPVSLTPATVTSALANAMMIASAASVAAAPLVLPALPLAMWSGKMASDVAVIRHRLLLESLYATTLSPSERASGLVLLPYPEEEQRQPREVCVCWFDLTRTRADEACFPLAAVRAAK